ncbi:MAG: fumarylacetoacetate hydrolase family protein [Pseudomonadota bacterium]
MSGPEFAFAPPAQPSIEIVGGGLFPVRRIFCIGKNYADHVAEMGGDVKTSAPVFFTKPADAVVASGARVPFPPATDNLHFEGELVVAIGGAGRNLETRADAGALIFGTACGCDLTRRDLQAAAKAKGEPWDAAKAFDRSAPVAPIGRSADFPPADFDGARLVTKINDEPRQNAPLSDMILAVPEIICALSRLFELRPGDLVFTGTPAGVGPLKTGDKVRVEIGALPPLEFVMGEAR